MSIRIVSCALLLSTALVVRAQGQSTVELGKRTARSRYTVGRIGTVQELADGRVVVNNRKENTLRLIDLTKGDDALIGKPGDAETEYRSAMSILPWRADSLIAVDLIGRKLLHLTPSGSIATSTPLSTSPGRLTVFAAADTFGNLYYSQTEFDTTAKTMRNWASIRRLGPSGESDVGRINTRRNDQTGNAMQVFPFRDAWAVRRDGVMARVMADSYQVIWMRDGHELSRTGPLPYTPIPITAAEQQQITDSIHQMGKTLPGAVTMAMPGAGGAVSGAGAAIPSGAIAFGGGGGGGSQTFIVRAPDGAGSVNAAIEGALREAGRGGAVPGANGPSPINMSEIPIAPFPAARPPIVATGNAAMFDMQGRLWVGRERVRGDLQPRYDVIAQAGGVVMQVRLPAGTRLVGFGRNALYLARLDGEDEWLEKYAIPKI